MTKLGSRKLITHFFSTIIVSRIYTLYSLSAFSLAKNLHRLFWKSMQYKDIVSYLLADNWLICRLSAYNVMHDFQEKCQTAFCVRLGLSSFSSNQWKISFCNIRNNHGLSKCYQPRPNNTYHYLDYLKYHKKTSSNNCLKLIFIIVVIDLILTQSKDS